MDILNITRQNGYGIFCFMRTIKERMCSSTIIARLNCNYIVQPSVHTSLEECREMCAIEANRQVKASSENETIFLISKMVDLSESRLLDCFGPGNFGKICLRKLEACLRKGSSIGRIVGLYPQSFHHTGTIMSLTRNQNETKAIYQSDLSLVGMESQNSNTEYSLASSRFKLQTSDRPQSENSEIFLGQEDICFPL